MNLISLRTAFILSAIISAIIVWLVNTTMSGAEIWFVTAPFAALLSFYCWEAGMDLLVPVRS